VAQVTLTVPGTEFRVGTSYTVPLSVTNAARLSMLTLTVTYNPNVLRVRSVQEGTFMNQGGVKPGFSQRVDPAGGRVDIAISRTGDRTGASGTGLVAALVIDAVAPGAATIQVSGVATAPDGSAVPLVFSSSTVTVK
jgi:predicted secreted protein